MKPRIGVRAFADALIKSAPASMQQTFSELGLIEFIRTATEGETWPKTTCVEGRVWDVVLTELGITLPRKATFTVPLNPQWSAMRREFYDTKIQHLWLVITRGGNRPQVHSYCLMWHNRLRPL